MGSAFSSEYTVFAKIASVAPNSDRTDSLADGSEGLGGADAQETVSVATAMTAGADRVIELRFTDSLGRAARYWDPVPPPPPRLPWRSSSSASWTRVTPGTLRVMSWAAYSAYVVQTYPLSCATP
jgi:hypothetical protein